MSPDDRRDGTDRPEDFLEPAVDLLRERRGFHIEAAQLCGYAADELEHARAQWAVIPSSNASSFPEIVNSGISTATVIVGDVFRIQAGEHPGLRTLQALATSAHSLRVATESTASIHDHQIVDPAPARVPDFVRRDPEVSYGARLEAIDTGLGETYAGIERNLFGGGADGARSALWAARQTFDHLFTVLAPDDEVRASEHWGGGSEDDPKLVTRGERIRYAATHHVPDRDQAEAMAESAKHAVELYRSLNRAHQRGVLEEEPARAAAKEMMAIIQAWADGVE